MRVTIDSHYTRFTAFEEIIGSFKFSPLQGDYFGDLAMRPHIRVTVVDSQNIENSVKIALASTEEEFLRQFALNTTRRCPRFDDSEHWGRLGRDVVDWNNMNLRAEFEASNGEEDVSASQASENGELSDSDDSVYLPSGAYDDGELTNSGLETTEEDVGDSLGDPNDDNIGAAETEEAVSVRAYLENLFPQERRGDPRECRDITMQELINEYPRTVHRNDLLRTSWPDGLTVLDPRFYEELRKVKFPIALSTDLRIKPYDVDTINWMAPLKYILQMDFKSIDIAIDRAQKDHHKVSSRTRLTVPLVVRNRRVDIPLSSLPHRYLGEAYSHLLGIKFGVFIVSICPQPVYADNPILKGMIDRLQRIAIKNRVNSGLQGNFGVGLKGVKQPPSSKYPFEHFKEACRELIEELGVNFNDYQIVFIANDLKKNKECQAGNVEEAKQLACLISDTFGDIHIMTIDSASRTSSRQQGNVVFPTREAFNDITSGFNGKIEEYPIFQLAEFSSKAWTGSRGSKQTYPFMRLKLYERTS